MTIKIGDAACLAMRNPGEHQLHKAIIFCTEWQFPVTFVLTASVVAHVFTLKCFYHQNFQVQRIGVNGPYRDSAILLSHISIPTNPHWEGITIKPSNRSYVCGPLGSTVQNVPNGDQTSDFPWMMISNHQQGLHCALSAHTGYFDFTLQNYVFLTLTQKIRDCTGH